MEGVTLPPLACPAPVLASLFEAGAAALAATPWRYLRGPNHVLGLSAWLDGGGDVDFPWDALVLLGHLGHCRPTALGLSRGDFGRFSSSLTEFSSPVLRVEWMPPPEAGLSVEEQAVCGDADLVPRVVVMEVGGLTRRPSAAEVPFAVACLGALSLVPHALTHCGEPLDDLDAFSDWSLAADIPVRLDAFAVAYHFEETGAHVSLAHPLMPARSAPADAASMVPTLVHIMQVCELCEEEAPRGDGQVDVLVVDVLQPNGVEAPLHELARHLPHMAVHVRYVGTTVPPQLADRMAVWEGPPPADDHRLPWVPGVYTSSPPTATPSTVAVSFHGAPYGTFMMQAAAVGDCMPDLVVAFNAKLPSDPIWIPVCQSLRRLVLTEGIPFFVTEHDVDTAAKGVANLAGLGFECRGGIVHNPVCRTTSGCSAHLYGFLQEEEEEEEEEEEAVVPAEAATTPAAGLVLQPSPIVVPAAEPPLVPPTAIPPPATVPPPPLPPASSAQPGPRPPAVTAAAPTPQTAPAPITDEPV